MATPKKVSAPADVNIGIDNNVVTAVGKLLVEPTALPAMQANIKDMYGYLEAYAQTKYAIAHLTAQADMLSEIIDSMGGMASVCGEFDSGENGTLTLRSGKAKISIKTFKLIAKIGDERAMRCMKPDMALIKKELTPQEFSEVCADDIIVNIESTGKSIVYNTPKQTDAGYTPCIQSKTARVRLDAALRQ